MMRNLRDKQALKEAIRTDRPISFGGHSDSVKGLRWSGRRPARPAQLQAQDYERHDFITLYLFFLSDWSF